MAESDAAPPVIWLAPGCVVCNIEDRCWCPDNAFEQCEECGAMPVKYVLALDQPKPPDRGEDQ